MTLIRSATREDMTEMEVMHQAYLKALTRYHHPDAEPHELDDKCFTDRDRLFPYVATHGDGVATVSRLRIRVSGPRACPPRPRRWIRVNSPRVLPGARPQGPLETGAGVL